MLCVQMEKERKLRNDKYDEAIEVSQSVDQSMASPKKGPRQNPMQDGPSAPKGMVKGGEQSKSQSVLNKPFDEALEFSQSGSDESVDTVNDKKLLSKQAAQQPKHLEAKPAAPMATSSQGKQSIPQMQQVYFWSYVEIEFFCRTYSKCFQRQQPKAQLKKADEGGESSDEEGDAEESYENLEGAYNAKDFLHLNVTAEVKDLFQYIERYKPQEVELATTLKCFIPEYIPTIGEMDAFIKVNFIRYYGCFQL